MAYIAIQLVETSIFTRRVQATFSPDAYRVLQMALLLRPDIGVVIPRSGGLRKMRWALPGRGKRSSVRIIYYWHQRAEQVVLVYLYRKNERSTLSPAELRILRALIDDI